MWPNLDGSPRTEQVSQKLLKQRSRRLLDGVLRKHMLVDSIKGYGDEMQYNTACRSPDSRLRQLSSALEGLRLIRERLRAGHTHSGNFAMFRNGGEFLPPLTTNRNLILLPGSQFVQTSPAKKTTALKPPINLFETAKHPNYTSPSPVVQSKSSARSAISNALGNSINFMNFSQKLGYPTMVSPDRNNNPTRLVPITIEQRNETAKINTGHDTGAQNDAKGGPKCKSSLYVPMLNNKIDSQLLNSRHSFEEDNSGMAEKVYNSYKAPSKAEEPRVISHENSVPRVLTRGGKMDKLSVHRGLTPSKGTDHTRRENIAEINMTNGNSTPKFRVKKIRIATGNENIADGDKNVIAGIDKDLHPYANGLSEARTTLGGTSSASVSDQTTDEKPRCDDREESFIRGMTFTSANIDKKSLNPSTLRIPSYKNKIKNKFSCPQGDVTARKSTRISNDVSNLKGVTDDATDLKTSKTLLSSEPNNDDIPRFYFPNGKPRPKGEFDVAIQRISEVYSSYGNGRIPVEDMGLIAKACGHSLYWKGPIFCAASEDPDATDVSESAIVRLWKRVASTNNDAASRFVALLAKPGKNCLDFEDFLPLLKDIVDTHPGLIFLKDAAEFHTRYMNTVIARIFYVINRSWSGQITAAEIRKSNFLTVLSLLEEEDDINAVTDYFSYEHFYVIYCKFWELDTDHDLVVDKHDLMGYGDGVISTRLLERVLSGSVTRWDTSDHQLGRMSYVDFVWFILSEEDKKTPTSIEYWFRCMDLDGDGFISMYEMEYFYEEQVQKLEQLDIEPLPFEDCICQVFDIVNPSTKGKVSLKDLKRCKMAHVFFDTFFNIAKYLNNEQKDPFVAQNTVDGAVIVISDWDNFAAEEYEMLVAEEQSNKLTDMSKALIDDDEGIDILEDESEILGTSKSQVCSVDQEGDINSEFTELTFIEPPGSEKITPLAQT